MSPLTTKTAPIAITVSRFNSIYTQGLLDGALKILAEAGIASDTVPILWVPGAFELPLTALSLAETGRFEAVICLGAVVKGDTPHFDFVAAEAARGISQVGLQTSLPIIFGVITTNTKEQALERSVAGPENRGGEAAKAALEMIKVLKDIKR